MHNNWIAVASAEHARRGCATPAHGFMQVCHGKCAPLKRVLPGDRVAYYAPTVTLGGKDKCQSFVSIGLVQPGAPYAFDMGGGFVPFRRDVAYVPAQEASILPLLDSVRMAQVWQDPVLAQASQAGLSKILSVLPPAARVAAQSMAIYAPPLGLEPAVQITLQTLREAVQARRKLRVDYRDASDQLSQRTLRPLGCFY